LYYVSPEGLGMPEEMKSVLRARGVPQKEVSSLEEILPKTDVLYVTRIQRERFNSEEEYQKVGIYFPYAG